MASDIEDLTNDDIEDDGFLETQHPAKRQRVCSPFSEEQKQQPETPAAEINDTDVDEDELDFGVDDDGDDNDDYVAYEERDEAVFLPETPF